jgi:hypothetical protein
MLLVASLFLFYSKRIFVLPVTIKNIVNMCHIDIPEPMFGIEKERLLKQNFSLKVNIGLYNFKQGFT